LDKGRNEVGAIDLCFAYTSHSLHFVLSGLNW
jgi:hypothetical protein